MLTLLDDQCSFALVKAFQHSRFGPELCTVGWKLAMQFNVLLAMEHAAQVKVNAGPIQALAGLGQQTGDHHKYREHLKI